MGLLRKPATSIPPAYPPGRPEDTQTVQAYIPVTVHRAIFLYLERGAINHTLSQFIQKLHDELARPDSGFRCGGYEPTNEAALVAVLSRLNFTLSSTGCAAPPPPKPKAQSRRRKHDPGAASDVRPTA